MLKKNKGKIILSSILILLPSLIGILLWDELPRQMAAHWNIHGNADRFSGRFFTAFGMPLILLALHWLCLFITALDKKNKEQDRKAFGLIFWIIPFTSFFSSGIIYTSAFGQKFDATMFSFLFMGLLFLVIGNYLPKCKQNHTIGIRITWTLANEENWNATHRFCGKLWVFGGLLFMVCVFLPKPLSMWLCLLLIILLSLVPILYSWRYYKKQAKEGTAPEKAAVPMKKSSKLICAVLLAAILAFVLFLCFTGSVKIRYQDSSFTISASYWPDLTVDYAAIDRIEYQEKGSAGSRTNGFGSPRLLLGSFENEEFGAYTRYTYTACSACVVLESHGDILVLNGPDTDGTKAIYEELRSRLEG